ncbi:protocatechuate 3,4-dioxygenase [Pigmentiphaga sp.]|uniref:protocatechuate 3,4-dioxygenase n=1 Tax=Pigmentiphaga sp. TaxID=1977564 RepID=UPI00128C4AAB|nr:protocatechuate 3,4-dioxygenase [Pigmentiphaga sp.]MPS27214.1 protocatechuate 3,4-dioxygenase [Alcaligenaceae bacterium SAGV5]MPS51642.1 protocatechuate 3,4-dioxygenase [Alcaligenaceae bacterium SAGV3]MPT55492.1 protocatechuate 3,4-dioxygenase [Alcaligenaceae bacterium]
MNDKAIAGRQRTEALSPPNSLPFGLEQSRAGYRLNQLARSMTQAANRQAFLADQEGYMRRLGLDDAHIRLVLDQDWFGLQAAGANQYALVKLAGTLGVSLLQEGAKIRGESFEQFMQTRLLHQQQG